MDRGNLESRGQPLAQILVTFEPVLATPPVEPKAERDLFTTSAREDGRRVPGPGVTEGERHLSNPRVFDHPSMARPDEEEDVLRFGDRQHEGADLLLRAFEIRPLVLPKRPRHHALRVGGVLGGDVEKCAVLHSARRGDRPAIE